MCECKMSVSEPRSNEARLYFSGGRKEEKKRKTEKKILPLYEEAKN